MTAPNPSFIWSFFLSAASFAALCVATSSLLARDSTILGRPSAKSHEVHAMIQEQLGKSVNELFTSFDDKPIGSASIGQVHRATLADGRDVVVKVQYPEVRHLFESDFTQLVGACYFWRPEALGEMREFRRQFMCEFDFRREARAALERATARAARRAAARC